MGEWDYSAFRQIGSAVAGSAERKLRKQKEEDRRRQANSAYLARMAGVPAEIADKGAEAGLAAKDIVADFKKQKAAESNVDAQVIGASLEAKGAQSLPFQREEIAKAHPGMGPQEVDDVVSAQMFPERKGVSAQANRSIKLATARAAQNAPKPKEQPLDMNRVPDPREMSGRGLSAENIAKYSGKTWGEIQAQLNAPEGRAAAAAGRVGQPTGKDMREHEKTTALQQIEVEADRQMPSFQARATQELGKDPDESDIKEHVKRQRQAYVNQRKLEWLQQNPPKNQAEIDGLVDDLEADIQDALDELNDLKKGRPEPDDEDEE